MGLFPILYRVQHSDSFGWILRHPERVMPVLYDEDKEKLLLMVAEHFKNTKVDVDVQICDELGRVLDRVSYRAK